MSFGRVFRQGSVHFQAISFLVVGGLQVGVDWLVFFALSAVGMPVALANLAGRVMGASLGFWLNGRVTFRREGQSFLGRHALVRFAVLWITMTVASTALVVLAVQSTGLSLAWLLKPLIEMALALVSFFISRHWVYR